LKSEKCLKNGLKPSIVLMEDITKIEVSRKIEDKSA